MNNLSVALSILGVIAGLLVAAATVVAFFRTQYAKATIETLRDSNDALKARVDELEAENGRQAVKLKHLEDEAADLRSYVSGTEAIARLEQQLADHHLEAMSTMARIERAIAARGTG